jgi:hypothetical protein
MANSYKWFLMMVIINLLALESTNGQNNQYIKSFDSVGISISKKNFDSLVATCTPLLELKTDTIAKADFITMIRLYNTITFRHLPDKKYRQFKALFFSADLAKEEKAIGAKLSSGMCLYSKELDLYIGGRPHQNSQFKIEN